MSERFKEPVLKTGDAFTGTVGSNPTLSVSYENNAPVLTGANIKDLHCHREYRVREVLRHLPDVPLARVVQWQNISLPS